MENERELQSLFLCLLAGQPCYHRGQRLQALLEDTDIRDAVALPASQQVLADLVDCAQQQVWRLQDHLRTHIESPRQGRRNQLRCLLTILRGEHLGHQNAQFEISKARSRRLTHPGNFLLKGLGSGVRDILPLAVGTSPGEKPDNVSLSGGNRKQALASAADVKRRVRALYRLGESL